MRTIMWTMALALAGCANDEGLPDQELPCTPQVWFQDADGDGFGDPALSREACEARPDEVAVAGDCDDALAAVHPEADEHCDGIDEDCDGAVDEDAVDPSTFHVDADGDGFGSAETVQACTRQGGMAETDGDCNDLDDAIHPGADEHCDGIDEDCDGMVDQDAVDTQSFGVDADGDGYAGPETRAACVATEGLVSRYGDCDDAEPTTYPGAEEAFCDGVDSDCDGVLHAAAIGSRGFRTLADAIVDLPDGAVLDVCPGVHEEGVGSAHSLTVQARNGDAETTVLAPPRGVTVSSAGDRLVLRNLTLQGRADAEVVHVQTRATHVEIEGCVVEGGSSRDPGAGLWWTTRTIDERPTLTIRDTVFRDNHTVAGGGAIDVSLDVPYTVTLDGVTFEDNSSDWAGEGGAATFGGKIHAPLVDDDGMILDIDDCTFTGNASYVGGALEVSTEWPTRVTIDDTSFTDNVGESAGGAIYGSGDDTLELVLTRVTFSGNAADDDGAAIYVSDHADRALTVTSSTFEDHTTGEQVVFIPGRYDVDVSVDLDDTTFQDNASGLVLDGGTLEATDCVFDNTSAGPAVVVAGDASLSGGQVTNNLEGLVVDGDLTLDAVDLGSGSTDNTEFDLDVDGAEAFYDGTTSLVCVDGTCE